MGGGAAVFGLVFMLFWVLVMLAVGAVILRAAVSLYNKIAGDANSPSAVPEPSMGKAMGIVFVTGLVNSLVGFMVGFAIGGAATATGAQGAGVNVTAQVVSLPISFVVMAGMLSALLPTTFGRGILVTLCHFVVLAAILVGFVIIGAMFTMLL